jgi:hypothetical protein
MLVFLSAAVISVTYNKRQNIIAASALDKASKSSKVTKRVTKQAFTKRFTKQVTKVITKITKEVINIKKNINLPVIDLISQTQPTDPELPTETFTTSTPQSITSRKKAPPSSETTNYMDEWFKHYFIDSNAEFRDFEELAKAISCYEQDANNQLVITRSGKGIC